MNEHRLEVADVFRQHGREFFARWGCALSAHQRKAFRDICACRTAARSRTPIVEDPVFGLRAAGPALMSNVSYFERRMVSWDPVNMRTL